MRYASLTLALIALAGCEATEPYLREGTWRPTGISDQNTAAQIIRPSDLVRGVDYAPVESVLPTAAVERYRAGKIRQLPESTLVRIGASGGGAPPADAPAGGTAAQ